MLSLALLADDRIYQHRNLGKAFYENPTTQVQAVAEFKRALDLAPNSARERLNYGLALLRAGKTAEGITEIEKAQKQDPTIPHTWFNLGIAFKKEGEYDRAVPQLERMRQLVPNEPITHYNLAVLYKLSGRAADALKEFESASRLDPNLAGPHFQLYNAYRQAGRADDAARELKVFQEIKKRNEGAAVPEDMEWSYYSEIYETVEPRAEAPPPAELRFTPRTLAKGLDPATAGLLVLDADGDGVPDLLAWSAAGVQLYRSGVTPVTNSGLAGLKDIVSIAAGDFDNDGLPDLCILTGRDAVLYHNVKGTFQKAGVPLPKGPFRKAVWLDYDHDYDLDLFLLGDASFLMRNQGAAGFSDQTAAFPFVSGPPLDATRIDLIADTTGDDLLVTYRDRPAVLYRDKLAGKFEPAPQAAIPAGATSLVAADLNRDGWTDVAYSSGVVLNRGGTLTPVSVTQIAGPLVAADFANRGLDDLLAGGQFLRNDGKAGFEPAKFPNEAKSAALAVADFDNDGRADLAQVTQEGALILLHNDTSARNNWLRVALTGVKNLKQATYAEVEVKSGASYQKRLYTGVPLLFGMGRAILADTVRITWPNGLIQNEPRQPVNKPLAFKEAQRLSGSCPMIFTWNGERFEFVTDVLGVAPLGASSGDGSYFPVDHDEYVQIPAAALAPPNGRYEIRITEELREVSYLDQIQLIAIDHPARTEIFTNDKFKAPPFPEFRLYGAEQRAYPTAARDSHGHDVLPRLLRRDRKYPDDFRRDLAGVAELHTLELDFHATPASPVLVLHGWVDWADGSTFLGASQQSNTGLVFPYLQVRNAKGEWQTVIEDMGIPAGKPKTIAVDLTGKFLSASRDVRIVTNLSVYWDEAFLIDAPAPIARLTRLDAGAATLNFRGFSKPRIDAERKQPESFDYAAVMPASMWNPTPGLYTRYGDVRVLLTAADDRMVVMGSGDELRLSFSAAALPSLAPGWKRDFLLFVDGWAKDGDANTAYSQTVEPLPFHAMRVYGEPFPHPDYQREYNTRPALRLLQPLSRLQ